MYNLSLSVVFVPPKTTAAVGTHAKIMIHFGQNEWLALLYINTTFLIKKLKCSISKTFRAFNWTNDFCARFRSGRFSNRTNDYQTL